MKQRNQSKKAYAILCFLVLIAGIFVPNEVIAEPIELWDKTLDMSDIDSGSGIAVDSNDNIIVVGCTKCTTQESDFLIIKYDSIGNILWNKTAGGSSTDEGKDVAVDSNNNIIVTGTTKSFGAGGSDIWTIKYDPDGNLIWNKTAGGIDKDYGFSVAIDSNNNIFVTGDLSSFGFGGNNAGLIKYDSNGNLMWNKTLEGGSGYGVVVDSNNNIIVTGVTKFFEKTISVLTIKCDPAGNIIWNSTVGAGSHDSGYGIAVDSNDNIIVTGQTTPVGFNEDAWTIKYNPDGNILWNKTVHIGDINTGRGVAVDFNNNIIITGRASFSGDLGLAKSDMWMIKYDFEGNLIWEKIEDRNFGDGGNDIAVDSGNNIIVTGETSTYFHDSKSEQEYSDVFTIKYKGSEIKEREGETPVEGFEAEKKLYDVEVFLLSSKKRVIISGSVEYSINIQNKGSKKDNYTLGVENLPIGWDYKFKEVSSGNAQQISNVKIDAGAAKDIILNVHSASDATSGEYSFVIKVSGNMNSSLNATLEVKGSYEMKLVIDNPHTQVAAGIKKEITIKVQNTGLSELHEIELDVTKSDKWDVTVTPSKVPSLKPKTTADFTLNIPVPADANISDFKMIVKAKSHEAETNNISINVTVNKPLHSMWVGFAMVSFAIIILIIMFRVSKKG